MFQILYKARYRNRWRYLKVLLQISYVMAKMSFLKLDKFYGHLLKYLINQIFLTIRSICWDCMWICLGTILKSWKIIHNLRGHRVHNGAEYKLHGVVHKYKLFFLQCSRPSSKIHLSHLTLFLFVTRICTHTRRCMSNMHTYNSFMYVYMHSLYNFLRNT